MRRKLIVREGTTERTVVLGATAIVGRDADCAICLNDPRLSRRHAEFVTSGQLVTVRDLQSRNGIEVNGVRATSAVLRPGDVVMLAEVSITFVEEADTSPGHALPADDRTVFGSLPPMPGAAVPGEAPSFPASHQPYAPASALVDNDATRIGSVVDVRPAAERPVATASPVAPASSIGGQEGPAEPTVRQGRFTWSDQVLLRTAALALLVGGVALAMAWLSQRALLTTLGEGRATALVGWLAAEGATQDRAALDAAVQTIGREPGVVGALVVAADGRVLAPTLRMTEPLGKIPGLDLAPADIVRLRMVEHNGRLELVKPVAGGKAIAWLTFSPSESGGGLGLAFGLTFIVAALGTFIAAGGIRRTTFAGLARFKEDVELVMSGQLTRATDTLGVRPLEDLASVVNYLVTRTRAGGGLNQVAVDGAGHALNVASTGGPSLTLRDAWIITDPSFKVSEASASITSLLGVRADSMIGKHLLDAVPDKQVSEAILKCLSGVSLHGRDETVIGGPQGSELGRFTVSVSRKGKHDPITIRFSPRMAGGQV